MKELVIRSGEDHFTAWALLDLNTCLKAWISTHSLGIHANISDDLL